MELIDIFLQKIYRDLDLKLPINALVSFIDLSTGKLLCELASDIIKSETSSAALTVLHFIDEDTAVEIGDMEYYKNELYRDIIAIYEKKQLLIRIFVKVSTDYVEDILEMENKYDCHLLLIGIEHSVFYPFFEEKYLKPKKREGVLAASEKTEDETGQHQSRMVDALSTILTRNTRTTGIFVNNGLRQLNRIFVPILDKTDVYVFLFINRLIFREKVSVMIWDAIGIIESDPEIKKLYQNLSKKVDGRLKLWNNEQKIEYDYIAKQDLVLIGIAGWEKLVTSAISWVDALPSTIIVKPGQINEYDT